MKKSQAIQKIFNGDIFLSPFFRHNRGLITFVAMLFFIQITVGYYSLFQHNKLTRKIADVAEVHAEYISLYCEYSRYTRYSNVISILKTMQSDLIVNTEPPLLLEPPNNRK